MSDQSASIGRVFIRETQIPVAIPKSQEVAIDDYARFAKAVGAAEGKPFSDARACLALFLHYAGCTNAIYSEGQRFPRAILGAFKEDLSDATPRALEEGRPAVESILKQIGSQPRTAQ